MHQPVITDSRSTRLSSLADGRRRKAGERSEPRELGAILVEYGMILVVILLVSLALVQVIGGRVLEMFQGVLPGFG